MTHTGDEPFQCPHCERRFTYKSNFIGHIAVHTGNKPYKCSKCSAMFPWPQSLAYHESMCGLPTFECEKCKKTFRQKRYLTEHSKIHEDGNPYQCSMCIKSFSHRSSLRKHLIRKHKYHNQCWSCFKCSSTQWHTSTHRCLRQIVIGSR